MNHRFRSSFFRVSDNLLSSRDTCGDRQRRLELTAKGQDPTLRPFLGFGCSPDSARFPSESYSSRTGGTFVILSGRQHLVVAPSADSAAGRNLAPLCQFATRWSGAGQTLSRGAPPPLTLAAAQSKTRNHRCEAVCKRPVENQIIPQSR